MPEFVEDETGRRLYHENETTLDIEKSKKKLLSHKEIEILEKSLELLNKGDELSSLEHSSKAFLSQTGLLSLKPKIIVCNVDEVNLKDEYYIKFIF